VPPQERRSADPETVAGARNAIAETRPAGGPRRQAVAASDEDAHRDDPDAEDQSIQGAQLLERELGARIIEEIRHE
jgi:DNA polymerase-3 subunit gamma/tau